MFIAYSQEVQQAIHTGSAIVALESTVIAHGLPYPHNLEVAQAMEAVIRERGATPATIAILDGVVHIGLETPELLRLAQAEAGTVMKASRRDIPIAIGLKKMAATTVAGTMILAHKAGIKVFATGGIGGVHRGHPFDVSADLMELGRTPITVVCAGAKSILDIPLTLEVLETQGVPIIGYSTDSLPLFYTRTSSYRIDTRAEDAMQVASIIRAAQDMEAQHGLLVVVPVPEENALTHEEAETAIATATNEADAQGISGNEVTPFVLSRVKELTNGRSLDANRALLINNAAIATDIALALLV